MNKDIKTWDNLVNKTKISNSDEQVNKIISQIVARRIELGLSQRDLAILTGIKQPAIARLESFRAVPRLDTILKIIEPLGLELKLIKIKEDYDII